MLRGNPPPPPNILFFLFLSISFPSLFKKNLKISGGFEPPEPPPPLKYALVFSPNQHSFMKGWSSLSALLSVYDEIILNLSNSQMACTDMIYLDFAKAFDKVDHGDLLHKLNQIGITGKLGNWLLSFFSNRNHFARIPGGVSSDGSVLSGVPQLGTVLGPLLFLVLLSDISSDINHSSVVSFAETRGCIAR